MKALDALALANIYGADISELYVTFNTQRFVEMMLLHGTMPGDAAELEKFKAYLKDSDPHGQVKYDKHYKDNDEGT